MKLSVIIVNYNVKYFLEQCLYSLYDALQGMDAEIWVVDNNSSDGSIEYLQPVFPQVKYLVNTFNAGFAKANNQALQMATGQYILFLNPDTLLPAEAVKLAVGFMDDTADAGALGIRMVDGSGRFLPESKRAFPSPFTSAFKLFGLSALFPRSKVFARYHLGHLSPEENHEADVLAGAFMLVRKEVLDKIGCFDETFFMYGEDIDLSFRIQKAGWKNYYFSGSSIIHFKGESTKKGSLNYVRMFYHAMNLFVQKHYSTGKAGIFKIFITVAIWLRAFISAFVRFIRFAGLPVIDVLLTLASVFSFTLFWEKLIKPGIEYPARVLAVIIPVFTLVFILAGAVAGIYGRFYRPVKAWVAMMLAVVFNLAVYSLFNVNYRFSRGVILFGGMLASAAILMLRYLLVKTNVIAVPDEKKEHRATLICGTVNAYNEAVHLMQVAGRNERILGRVSPSESDGNAAARFSELSNLLETVPAKEIVFCINRQLPLAKAIGFMQQQAGNIRYKIFYEGSQSIIGSDSKETSGEILSGREKFSIDNAENRHVKRMTDVGVSILLLLLTPLSFLLVKKPVGLLSNVFAVLGGGKTWVGYCTPSKNLPALPKAVIGCNGLPPGSNLHINTESLVMLDYWYAKDYDWLNDCRIIFKYLRHPGDV